MHATFDHAPGLPKLGWLAIVDHSTRSVRVAHGDLVEIRGSWFVEGVWDGDFAEGAFDTTDCFFGSGGVARGDSVVFVSSASTTDYLYYATSDSRTFVANSLPLLLAARGDRLDPKYSGYRAINRSIVTGIRQFSREIPTRCGSVQRLMHDNLCVSAAGVEVVEKPLPPAFPTYEAYVGYLVDRYASIAANARDTRRACPMSILTTQSRGYDTTAVNAIATRAATVDRAFTVTRGKVAGVFADRESAPSTVDDDGTEICTTLGIPCIPIDRRSFESSFDDEYLYYATLDDNGDFNLREIVGHVDGAAVLLTGTLGEVWYTERSYDIYTSQPEALDDQLRRGDLGGHGLTEVRLAAGLVHLPLPYMGARRRRDIFAITESNAMDPWRLGNRYDRPIPRRIAEERGIPRTAFGQAKMATVVEFTPPAVPYGSILRSEYLAFLARERILSSAQQRLLPFVHRVNGMLWFAGEGRHAWLHYLQRSISKLRRRDFRFPLLWRRLDGKLFCYCANRRADEMAAALPAAFVE
ncbi:MAG TPA: hypothetical protein VN650_14335 [Gemmatimonadaceae bacterium]|nr:hypothetical protein [Gemmatimonadaceae bacterium]